MAGRGELNWGMVQNQRKKMLFRLGKESLFWNNVALRIIFLFLITLGLTEVRFLQVLERFRQNSKFCNVLKHFPQMTREEEYTLFLLCTVLVWKSQTTNITSKKDNLKWKFSCLAAEVPSVIKFGLSETRRLNSTRTSQSVNFLNNILWEICCES